MEKESIVQIGGSVETAIKGEYSLDVAAIAKEAWQLTLASRLSINLGLFICLVIAMATSMLASTPLGGIEVAFKEPQSMTLVNIIVILVVYPFVAGVEMMGVFHSVGLKTQTKLVFAFLKRGSWIAVCALLTSTLVQIGVVLFFIPGIFLAVALSLTIPLVIEKKMTPMKAIIVSIQATRFQWFKIFSLYMLVVLFMVIATLPIAMAGNSEFGFITAGFFLFCLTYIVPLFYNIKGVLYREIFGLQMAALDEQHEQNNDIFSA